MEINSTLMESRRSTLYKDRLKPWLHGSVLWTFWATPQKHDFKTALLVAANAQRYVHRALLNYVEKRNTARNVYHLPALMKLHVHKLAHMRLRNGKLYTSITSGGARDVTESVYWAKGWLGFLANGVHFVLTVLLMQTHRVRGWVGGCVVVISEPWGDGHTAVHS